MTNVVSELMKPSADPRVYAWVAEQSRPSSFTTAITEAEIWLGIALLSDGRRKSDLTTGAVKMFKDKLFGYVLPFDREAAEAYALIASERRKSGRPISQSDAQIAGITRSRSATLATRNIRDFENCGIDLIDPWSA